MLLTAQKLRKEYPQGSGKCVAVNDVDLTLKQGEFVSIIGRSGSGKSTLLNMLVGLLTPLSGNVIFDEKDYSRLNDEQLCYLRNERIGYVPQGMSLLGNFTILENVCLPWFLEKRTGNIVERAKSLLAEVGLAGYENQYPKQLSGGQARRVAIARGLINSPELLVADEPTSNLDTETASEIMRLFKKLSLEGIAILIVTHDSDCEQYSDLVYKMESGNLSRL